jgi:hypothetical protein
VLVIYKSKTVNAVHFEAVITILQCCQQTDIVTDIRSTVQVAVIPLPAFSFYEPRVDIHRQKLFCEIQ